MPAVLRRPLKNGSKIGANRRESCPEQWPKYIDDREIISRGIYRQQRSFLMLELMIALFLVGLCALPLAQFPTRAAKEEYNSAYRMQAQRLADLAFAEVKEKLYRQEISWKTISSAQSAKSIIPIDAMDVSIDPPYKKKFSRQATIYSVGKKTQNAEQWRLATIRIKITPQQKGIKLFRSKKSTAASRVFTYQVLINKAPISETTPSTLEPLPIKETR